MTYSLKRLQRLLKAGEYQYVFDQPFKSSDRYLTVLARPNTLAVARLGLAITKKRVKTAVMRNRLKRLIRESFRLQQHALVGLDYVVLAKNDVAEVASTILRRSLNSHWHVLARQCKNS
ncbi:MAG: ribonuclease P protein component [Beggiatoa sp. IS2]|nr:MAG: ribonuclease P protein component [Beggiatoa sp. IS2]